MKGLVLLVLVCLAVAALGKQTHQNNHAHKAHKGKQENNPLQDAWNYAGAATQNTINAVGAAAVNTYNGVGEAAVNTYNGVGQALQSAGEFVAGTIHNGILLTTVLITGDGYAATRGSRGSWTCNSDRQVDPEDRKAAEFCNDIYYGCQNEERCFVRASVRVEIVDEEEENTCYVVYRGTSNLQNIGQDLAFGAHTVTQEYFDSSSVVADMLSERTKNRILDKLRDKAGKGDSPDLDADAGDGQDVDEDAVNEAIRESLEQEATGDNGLEGSFLEFKEMVTRKMKETRERVRRNLSNRTNADEPSFGMIHWGFLSTHDLIVEHPMYDQLLSQCVASNRRIVFTGHSLGGALATIGMFQFAVSGIYDDYGFITFGSPRVGDITFANTFQDVVGARNGKRFESVSDYMLNEGRPLIAFDPVARVPMKSLGFQHVGVRWQVPCDSNMVAVLCHSTDQTYIPGMDRACRV